MKILPPPPLAKLPPAPTLLPPPPAPLEVLDIDHIATIGDAISVGYVVSAGSRKQLKLFDAPLPPAPEGPEDVTDWYHTSQRPYRNGIYEIQQLFGEIHRLHYNVKKDCWYYVDTDNVSVGEMCCAGDSLHIIASGWRGLKGPAA